MVVKKKVPKYHHHPIIRWGPSTLCHLIHSFPYTLEPPYVIATESVPAGAELQMPQYGVDDTITAPNDLLRSFFQHNSETNNENAELNMLRAAASTQSPILVPWL